MGGHSGFGDVTRGRRRAWLGLVCGGLLGGLAVGPATAEGASGASVASAPQRPGAPGSAMPVPVRHQTITLVDTSRPTEDPIADRDAPTRTLVTEVYVPGGKGPFPLVVMAHGNLGNPGKLSQLQE